MTKKDTPGVEAAVRRDLLALAKRQAGLDKGAEAATAIALAREMDSPNSATSKSMCARALNETMVVLRSMAPSERKADRLDEVATARAKRRAAL